MYRHISMKLMFLLNEMSFSLFLCVFSSTESTHLYSITENKHNREVWHIILPFVFILRTQVRHKEPFGVGGNGHFGFINRGDLNKTIIKNLIFFFFLVF